MVLKLYISLLYELKTKNMERPVLSVENDEILKRIENEIDEIDDLEEKMDYVDCLAITFEFEDLDEDQEDLIDEYLRDYV